MKDPSGVEAKEFGLTDPLDLLPIYFKSETFLVLLKFLFCLSRVEVQVAVWAPSGELLDVLFVVSLIVS